MADLRTPGRLRVAASLRMAGRISAGTAEIGELAAAAGCDREATAILRRCAETGGRVFPIGAVEHRDLTVEMPLVGRRHRPRRSSHPGAASAQLRFARVIRTLAALTALVEGAGLTVGAVRGQTLECRPG